MISVSEKLAAERRIRLHSVIVVSMCVLLLLSLLDPQFPKEQLLQHIPTVPSLAVILLGARRGWWSTTAIICLMIFAFAHILGSRFIYTCFPYEEIIKSLTGWSVNEAFGWQRNHYDRFVHLLFGMIMPLPVAELVARRNQIDPVANVTLSIGFVGAISGIYEVLEWFVAIVMSPEMAESYNGQQGDLWDPQKDMALAFLGSLLVAVPVWRRLHGQRAVG